MKSLLVIAALASIASPAQADTCTAAHGRDVQVTLGTNTKVRDLVTWFVSSCENVIIARGIIDSPCGVDVAAPTVVSPAEAHRLFITVLAKMGLTIVPRGSALRVVRATTQREPLAQQAVFRKRVKPVCKPISVNFPVRVSP